MMPKGNVEAWLGEVECRMKASIRTQVSATATAALALLYSAHLSMLEASTFMN
jgi:hypothetical protein